MSAPEPSELPPDGDDDPARVIVAEPEPMPDNQKSAQAGGKRKRTRKALIEWGIILAVAVLAAVLLRTFIVQPYYIPSGSMEPTLMIGDKVLVNKLSYDFHSVHRGDIIVFKKPPDDDSPGITDLIKRIIGLPNETISAENGSVYINGKMLHEPWLPRGVITANFPPLRVPSGEYFVMGDNRGNSADSRVIGPISKNLIVGKADVIVWPLGRIHFF